MFKRLKNRLRVWRFPYIKPHTFTGEEIPNYKYDYTDIDCFPDGWHKTIIKYLKKLNKILKKYGETDNFFITDTKEKWGTARIYYSGIHSEECMTEIDNLFCDMERETWNTCCECGSLADYNSIGYILPFCEKCTHKQKYLLNFEKKDKEVTNGLCR